MEFHSLHKNINMIKLTQQKDGFGNFNFIATGEIEDFYCCQCKTQIDEGFVCENNMEKVLCKDCQDEFKMEKCKHDKTHQHRHIKFIRWNNAEQELH